MKATDLERDLARSLATGGNWMVWTQLPLGSIMFDAGVGIVDVLAVKKSWTTTSVIIYEVKISRGDFNRDIQQGKYLRYLNHCTQFYFATPAGMVRKEEIPDGCGLITRTDNKGWHTVKAARRRDYEWDARILLKLLMRGFQDHFPAMRKLDRERYEEEKELRWLARGKGAELAERLAGAENYIKMVERLKAELAAALGDGGEDIARSINFLRNEVSALLAKKKYAREATEMAELTMKLFEGSHYPRGVAQRLRAVADNLDEQE